MQDDRLGHLAADRGTCASKQACSSDASSKPTIDTGLAAVQPSQPSYKIVSGTPGRAARRTVAQACVSQAGRPMRAFSRDGGNMRGNWACMEPHPAGPVGGSAIDDRQTVADYDDSAE